MRKSMVLEASLMLAVILFLCLALPQAVSAQEPIYVDQTATGAGDGTSWANAYTTLQDALANANAGVLLKVATGRPTSHPTPATSYGWMERSLLCLSILRIFQ